MRPYDEDVMEAAKSLVTVTASAGAVWSGPKVIKILSNQLSMKFYQLIHSKSLESTIVYLLSLAEYVIFSACK